MASAAAASETLRVAFWTTELHRDGPGLLLRDLTRGTADDITAVLDTLRAADADIVVLQGIDWDYEGRALGALATALAEIGAPYPHHFAPRPNTGRPSGLDLDGNGRAGEPQDAVGFGRFTGQNGLAVLSRAPIATGEVIDFTEVLWSDLPGALLPYPGMPTDLPDRLPLSSTAHALVPVDSPGQGRLWLGVFAATPPVFDGPEDRNGRRNHDEVMFWVHLLNGALAQTAPPSLILAGNANLDPERGDGRRGAIRSLLTHPAMQDAVPMGDLGTATVDFGADSAGALRVAYLLPDQSWQIHGAGMLTSPLHRHRLVWLDLTRR